MIEVQRLIYEYPGKRALNDVSFTIKHNGITALVGPNGAGKTTLLRCLAALDEPFSGEVLVGGINVANDPRSVHKNLGYLSDFSGLYDDLTVTQCLIHAARLHGMDSTTVKKRVEEVISLLELSNYAHVEAGNLSRGWRQRLGIGQAIIHKPSLLLLDEPASGLDPESRITLSQLFRKLRDGGMTLVVSSHILAELEDYCTDMLVLRDGKIVDHKNSELQSQTETYTVLEIELLNDPQSFLEAVRAAAGVHGVTAIGNSLSVQFAGNAEAKHQLLKNLIGQGAMVTSFNEKARRLQDVYMTIASESKRHEPKS